MPQFAEFHFDWQFGDFLPCTAQQSKVSIWLWHIAESEEQLFQFWHQHSHAARNCDLVTLQRQYQSKSRRKEWLVTRCLLAQVLGAAYEIAYLPSGQPFVCVPPDLSCKGQPFISISHTAAYVALTISPYFSIGLDLEQNSCRANGIASRFLQSEEQAQLLHNPSDATALWCAKEAIYKLAGIPQLRFLDQITLTSLAPHLLCAEFGTSTKQRAQVLLQHLEKHALTLALAIPIPE